MMLGVRTTVTLDEDVASSLRAVAQERGQSFKETLNSLLRQGLAGSTVGARPYRVPVVDLGLRQGVDLDKALGLAAQDEDDEVVRKLAMRK